MIYWILGIILLCIIFVGGMIYKLRKPEWWTQILCGKFTDTDLITRIIKFLE